MKVIKKDLKGIYFCESCKKLHFDFLKLKKIKNNLMCIYVWDGLSINDTLFFAIMYLEMYCLIEKKNLLTLFVSDTLRDYGIFSIYDLKNNSDLEHDIFYFIELEFEAKDKIMIKELVSSTFLIKLKQKNNKVLFRLYNVNKLINESRLNEFAEIELIIENNNFFIKNYKFLENLYKINIL